MHHSMPGRQRLPMRLASLTFSALFIAALAAPPVSLAAPSASPGVGAATSAAAPGAKHGKDAWTRVTGKPAASHQGHKAEIKADKLAAYKLDKSSLKSLLATAPREKKGRATATTGLTVTLPTPTGAFQSFRLEEAPIMEPALAEKHPDITTYRGTGIEDATATIRADVTPLGFHASVRSSTGAWYIDPIYHLDQSLYASYYGRDLRDDSGTIFVERDIAGAELSVDRGYYHAADPVTVSGNGFTPGAVIEITISDPLASFADRTVGATADNVGSFTAEFTADPDGNLDTHLVTAADGVASASNSYQVVRDDDPTVDPPTGDVLRTYRLALITDPGYAVYHGGAANVTAAKVTLINRVTQVYEDDLSIRLLLVANNDLLNFNTWDQAIAPNGPCGAAACFALSNVTGCSSLARNRIVIGQIIGASNYDIGHLALGQPGGGVANLGVVGRAAKAQGCTGIPTPTGDFYAIDYVAHEMGHQFSGNHPFNGNQLNCSGGNRNQSTSVEPGSGSSIMAYAGICTADDLQAHSDPYFSERSLQEISTYTASDQNAINEVQEIALRHFGGGNEVQVATFGPGFAPTSTIQPLSVAIGAVPSTTQLGGADETGNIVTITSGATGAIHTLQVGDVVTISGVANAGYNGTFTVASVLTSRAFTYVNPIAGLPRSGGGTFTLAVPGLRESGNTVTVSTNAAHGRSVGDVVTISGAGNAGYNGSFTITSVPTPRQFTYENATAGLPNAGGGTMTFISPFKLRVAGNANDSALINSANYSNAGLTAAFAGIAGFGGTATVSGTANTGFTVTYTGASAATDVGNFSLETLTCGGCFSVVQETNHGGSFDSFTLHFNGNTSAPIVNGTNYTAAGLTAALAPILPAGTVVTLTAFGGGNISGLNNQGFGVGFGGTQAATNVPFMLEVTNPTAGLSGFVNELDKGGAVDNKGGIITPTGNTWPAVTAPTGWNIPLRTPFALTGSATDGENDAMLFAWEQNDRGAAAGTTLLNNTKTNGPLFAMFPISGQISLADALQYDSPGENHLTSNPTRVFPDIAQIAANNTNADTGACPTGPIAPPVPVPVTECFAEFLPTTDYVGFAGTNAAPPTLHFRFTARDNRGGVNSGDTTLTLIPTAGPFRVTSQAAGDAVEGDSTQTVTWDVAGTDLPPIGTTDVAIRMSTDGGLTYPIELVQSTPNDGSADVVLPNVATTEARIKVEAIGNVYFDISNTDFPIHALPVVTNTAGEGATVSVQYSDSLSPALTVTATDADSDGPSLTAAAVGLPAGLSLGESAVTAVGVVPGSHTWDVEGTVTDLPGTYPVTVTVTDDTGGTGSTSFTIEVAPENAVATYTGDTMAYTPTKNGTSATVLLRATVQDSSLIPAFLDAEPGDISTATLTFTEGATTLCGPLAVAPIGPGTTTTGSAWCTTSLATGTHTIDIWVNGNYTGTTQVDVVVGPPPAGSHMNLGGKFDIGTSAGTYKGNDGSEVKVNLDIHAEGKGPKGHLDLTYQAGANKYEIDMDDPALVAAARQAGGTNCNKPPSTTCSALGYFRGTASLIDVTKGTKKTTIATGLTVQVTLTDRGKGKDDSIGVTVWDGSTLVFSSDWNGAQTLERPVTGGNIDIH